MWVLCIVPDWGLGPRALMKPSFWASILCYFSSGCRMGGEMSSNLFLDIGYYFKLTDISRFSVL